MTQKRWGLAWERRVISHHGKVFFNGQIKEERIFYDSLSTPYHPSTFSLFHSPTHALTHHHHTVFSSYLVC